MKVISARFKESGRSYYFDPGALTPAVGEYVIVETARGVECGEVVRAAHDLPDTGFDRQIKPVVRMADGMDIRRMRQNRADERAAFVTCEKRIAAHKLQMKLIDAEYTLDRNKLVFYFTADNRVDFRELVKDLAAHFHTRIELRQIGVRDESKMLGGLGVCGQPFCCSRFLKNFQPVSIKMAKEQGLSLNPSKISGACGRLMCCLAYEQKSYEYLNSITPPPAALSARRTGRAPCWKPTLWPAPSRCAAMWKAWPPEFTAAVSAPTCAAAAACRPNRTRSRMPRTKTIKNKCEKAVFRAPAATGFTLFRQPVFILSSFLF